MELPWQLLTWKNLIMMTMAFSVLVAPLGGIPPIVGVIFAVIFFGFSNINKEVRESVNEKGRRDVTQRRAAFIGCLVVGVVVSYVVAWVLLAIGLNQSEGFSGFGEMSVAAGGGIIAGLGLGVIMTAVCLSFFINYGTVLGWWTPTGGLVTLLISIIPARMIGRNVGINMLVSFIVSSFVYAGLVRDNKNKKEPWMIGQSAYIGIMVGTAVALVLPSSDDVLTSIGKKYNLSTKEVKEVVKKTGLSSDVYAKSSEGAINSMVQAMWVVYFIIWILTHVPVALPYGWDTLFKYK